MDMVYGVKLKGMMLLLHKRDGTVKARCEECRRLYEPGARELAALGRDPSRYAMICSRCIAESLEWARRIGNIPERRKRKA